MVTPPTEPDLVEIDIGFDRFVAQAIEAECETAGLRARVLMMDDTGHAPGMLALAPHRLLTTDGDAGEVRRIVQHWLGDDAAVSAVPRASGRWAVRAVAFVLLTIIVVALLVTAF